MVKCARRGNEMMHVLRSSRARSLYSQFAVLSCTFAFVCSIVHRGRILVAYAVVKWTCARGVECGEACEPKLAASDMAWLW